MKRSDKIYSYIKEYFESKTIDEVLEKKGLSAIEISEELNILRNNVSMELNALLRQDKIIKVKGRPVLYIPRQVLEKKFNKMLPNGPLEVECLSEFGASIKHNIKEEKVEDKCPFDLIIGAKGSLKNQIEQAKAAVLYPPNGLHTLILGPTGVGKTLFVNVMYNYAKYKGKLNENSPFIVFNCADYYNNPQLLISQIFGHIKGAFTGADSAKEGLVEKADGGILFLDEIHRLPPEGQEMIFYFMDTGTFNKLGETERTRKSNVLIIGATTEDPSSSLLKTFVRRIPITINIPSLDERAVEERLEIIKFLIGKEAHRIDKPIRVTVDVMKALLGSVSFGNIGQLKSNIQLICAKGFLNSINSKDYVDIDFKTLPANIKDGILRLGVKRTEVERVLKYVDTQMIITPDGRGEMIKEDNYEPPFNLYKIIEDKAAILRDEGLDEDYIKKFITTDINVHIKCFYDKFKYEKNSKENLSRIVDNDILEVCEEIKEMAEVKLKRKLNDRFLYALSLHVSSFLKRIRDGEALSNTANLDSINEEHKEEYKVALHIKEMLEAKYSVVVPEVEIVYLTLLLSSVSEVKSEGKVAIIVAAHGSSTASSMVNVATKLLGNGNIMAVDMPLDVPPREILDTIVRAVDEMDMGKGALLLVDMGSLSSFEEEIINRTEKKVKTIEMVTTPIVLEALRKSNLFDMDLEEIYKSLKEFKGYGKYEEENGVKDGQKVIVTICSTGEGTAIKLKEIIEDVIVSITDEDIPVIPLGLDNLEGDIEKLQKSYEIIASVGVKDPKIEAPFISLESLIDGSGEGIIKDIVKNNYSNVKDVDTKIVTKDLCEDSLKQFLTYLNPYKITGELLSFCSVLGKELGREFSNSMTIRLVIHIACALERMILKDGLEYKGNYQEIDENIINSVKKVGKRFKNSLNIELTDDEVYYICIMLMENSIEN